MQRPGFVEKLDRIQPYLLGAAALLLALCILFAGGEIGLSDNGDFSRVMRASSIARTVDDSRFVYISEYRIVLQDRSAAENVFGILFGSEGVNVYPSIQLLFTRVSVVLNLIVNKLSGAPMTTYRLGVLGVLYAVCYAAALELLFRQIHLRRRWMDWGVKLLLLLVLCDGDYLVYFNSFYGEALQIIAFVLVAAAAVRILSRRDCSVWDAVWAALACILYGWSKFANIPPAILLCLALEAILWRRSRSRCSGWCSQSRVTAPCCSARHRSPSTPFPQTTAISGARAICARGSIPILLLHSPRQSAPVCSLFRIRSFFRAPIWNPQPPVIGICIAIICRAPVRQMQTRPIRMR